MQKGFLCFIFGFAGGIAFRSFFDFGIALAAFLVLLGAVCIVLGNITMLAGNPFCKMAGGGYGFCKKEFLASRYVPFSKKGFSPAFFIGLFFIAAGAGMLRFDFSESPARAHALDAYLGKTIIFEGSVADEPDARASHTKLTIETKRVIFGNETVSARTKILVIAERYPEFSYGDTVRIRGAPQRPPRVVEDDQSGGRPFDYAAYLAKDGVYYEMFHPHIERLSSGGLSAEAPVRSQRADGSAQAGGNPVKRALFSLKRAYLKNLGDALPEPHAALAGGITVGAKEALGKDLIETFRTAGIIHIVVLSGYNIAIIARMFGRAAFFLPRMAGIGLSAAVIVFFALMTGAGATVVRASAMALIALLARATGRVNALTVALLAAAFLMLIANPRILVFDPSFQLSFLATLGILYLVPRVERLFLWLPAAWGIREAASATLATQIFVLPALVYMTGKFSIVSFAANLFILPLMPASMLFSFLSGAFAFFTPAISVPFSYIAWVLLEYALRAANFFASFPFAAVSVPPVSAWFFVGAYGFLVGAILRNQPMLAVKKEPHHDF